MEEKKIHSPYPGLRPYREDERDKFFGREADKAILVDKILGNRLTLLFAASGVGKSSLLQAAVIPHLKAAGGENLSVVYSIDWVRDEHSTPLSRLHDAILKALRDDGTLPVDAQPETGTLAELLEFCGLFARPPLVLILDQFEEFFRYQQHSTAFRPFIEQLTEVITDVALPVSVVISMREDYAMELNAFKPQLPTLLFENFFRLEKLKKENIHDVIRLPALQAGYKYEQCLIDALLTDLLGKNFIHFFDDSIGFHSDSVDFPYLQIVCSCLWNFKDNKHKLIQYKAYENLGGAKGILSYHLDVFLKDLSKEEKYVADRVFSCLMNFPGVKIAYTLDGLLDKLMIDKDFMSVLLHKLERKRIVRKVNVNNDIWWQLSHDMYSQIIREWQYIWNNSHEYDVARSELKRKELIGFTCFLPKSKKEFSLKKYFYPIFSFFIEIFSPIFYMIIKSLHGLFDEQSGSLYFLGWLLFFSYLTIIVLALGS